MKVQLTVSALLLLACGSALATTTHSDRRETLENGIVQLGDSAASVLKAGGEPKSRTDLRNAYNAKIGERWQYVYHGNEIRVTFDADGVVVKLEEDL